MNQIAEQNHGSSKEKLSRIPESWIEKIFRIMENRYGSLWADRYGAFPRNRVLNSWAEDLADMGRDELARGVVACRDHKFPPTLPEFRALCRPAIDYESAYSEAIEQMHRRKTGSDSWSRPEIYWSAAKLGSDLHGSSYQAIKGRWRAALDDAIEKVRDGKLPSEIPIRHKSLPPTGQCSVPTDEAQRRLANARDILSGKVIQR